MSSPVFALNFDINEIALGTQMAEGIEKVKAFSESFDENNYVLKEKQGLNTEGDVIYYANELLAKYESEATSANIQLVVQGAHDTIWSVVKFEKYLEGHMPLKTVVIDKLKEKYGEPTHSSSVKVGYNIADIYWLYDNDGNLVTGQHNEDNIYYDNDPCSFTDNIVPARDTILKIRKFNDNPKCGQFVYAQLYTGHNPEYVSEYRLMTVDFHKQYKRLIEIEQQKKLAAEQMQEEKRKKAENIVPNF